MHKEVVTQKPKNGSIGVKIKPFSLILWRFLAVFCVVIPSPQVFLGSWLLFNWFQVKWRRETAEGRNISILHLHLSTFQHPSVSLLFPPRTILFPFFPILCRFLSHTSKQVDGNSTFHLLCCCISINSSAYWRYVSPSRLLSSSVSWAASHLNPSSSSPHASRPTSEVLPPASPQPVIYFSIDSWIVLLIISTFPAFFFPPSTNPPSSSVKLQQLLQLD